MKESELIEPVINFLEPDGWYCVADIDGTDYFDIACVRGNPKNFTVMLVELKLNQPKTVFTQAFKRKWYADMVSIGMPKLKSICTVYRYDLNHEFGLIVIGEDTRWYQKPKMLSPDRPRYRNRIAGTLFAIKEGIIERPPTATFMFWDTSWVCGVSVERYTTEWPQDIRELIGCKPIEEKVDGVVKTFNQPKIFDFSR